MKNYFRADDAIIEALRASIPKLDEDHQLVIILHYFYGLSAAQIGISLATKRCTVLARLRRARLKLRTWIEDYASCRSALDLR